MRTFKLEIDMGNIDFEAYGETSVVTWILEKVSEHLREHNLPDSPLSNESSSLFDLTGNKCGSMGVHEAKVSVLDTASWKHRNEEVQS